MFMIEMKVLQARQGDCIWIRCISDRIVNIVIDAGPSTFKKDLIKQLLIKYGLMEVAAVYIQMDRNIQ